jgi:hypothetical protein
MRLVIVFFVLAVLTVAATSVGLAVWDGHTAHRDGVRAIHYDTSYSGQLGTR